MAKFWSTVGPFLAELFLKVIAPFLAFHAGRESEKKDATLKALEEMREAKELENRLANDPDFVKSVRDKYR